ncbi:hypothetical protein GQ42DRAFT_165334 [Ramicandelaber brevisporus]|nr:hypothetical protein GQ42DRAFT_165334 [Ramicandelaber brevisporus]
MSTSTAQQAQPKLQEPLTITSSGETPLPPSHKFVEAVRESCAALTNDASSPIKVNSAGVDKFLDGLDMERFNQLGSNGWVVFPLKFDSLEQEVGLVGIVDLLNFGSGFRKPLHDFCDRGAAQTILYGAMSMHISQTDLSAKGLQELKSGDVSKLFGISLLGPEVPHPSIAGVTIAQPNGLKPLVDMITQTLNETGHILEINGYRSLGHYLLETAKESTDSNESILASKPSAAAFVEQLVRTFPAFRDMETVDGKSVYLFKKAQLLASDLKYRFPDHFQFEDDKRLTVYSDNVLPAVLAALGVLDLPAELTEKIQVKQEPVTLEECARLRAAAIEGSERIVKAARARGINEVNTTSLDHYLWHIGKDKELRKIPRLEYRTTVYF